MLFYLYKHYSLIDNSVFYIGYGNKKRPYDKNSRNTLWNEKVYVEGGFKPEIIYITNSLKRILQEEIKLIAEYGRFKLDKNGILVNRSKGGEYGAFGSTHVLSEEAKKMIQQKLKGKTRSNKVKEKISKSKQGLLFTASHKDNISKGKIGFLHTQETKQKISNKQKNTRKKGKKILQLDNNFYIVKVFSSATDAAFFLNKNKMVIANAANNFLKGKNNKVYGYYWKYK